MFLINSCLGRFSAAGSHRLPFSLTYGVNLPSSLTTLLPIVLGSSPHLPVSVCGTGGLCLDSGFSCQCGLIASVLVFPPHQRLAYSGLLSPAIPPALDGLFLLPVRSFPLRPRFSGDGSYQYRILNLLSIGYAALASP